VAEAPGSNGKTYKLLSVIVPVYNERNTVPEIIRRMRQADLPIDREIIMVDDGSDDGTDKIWPTVEDSTVRVVRHPSNQGKAAAVRTGLAAARGDVLLIQDADLEYDPEDWAALIAPILRGKAEVVFGSRYSGDQEAISYMRHLADRSLSVFASLLYNTALPDILTGYKAFARDVIESITIESDGFDLEPEITAKLIRGGHRIYVVPIAFSGRTIDEGRKFTWRDQLAAARTLVKYRFKR
jgi:glycosyltransferase involved in cell wall biosynthesis